MDGGRLEQLTAGMAIPFGGDRLTHVSEALAAAFQPGDRLIVIQETGELLRVPAEAHDLAALAVERAAAAFAEMNRADDAAITAFFDEFAQRLQSDAAWAPIAAANDADVERARARGRSTTRLAASPQMRADMIAGLTEWRDAAPSRGRLVERIEHPGWSVEQVTAPLGVVGFVFEGRPNVFADAAGVLRGGNTVVFRIGSDALGTARAITEHALAPALAAAGLPPGACVLVESPEHAAGWALFSDQRLALAVARGSGPAVAQLGAVARQAGVPVSLHGTGGAWIVADETADVARFAQAVAASLDRKACNTLNVCCIVRAAAGRLAPKFLIALQAAGMRRGHGCKLHVAEEDVIPESWREARTKVRRADGDKDEPLVEVLPPRAGPRMGVGGDAGGQPEDRRGRGRGDRALQPAQPPLLGLADLGGSGRPPTLLRRHRGRVRGRRHDPLGGRPVCLQPPRARPFQLGARSPARPRRRALRRQRLYHPCKDASEGSGPA